MMQQQGWPPAAGALDSSGAGFLPQPGSFPWPSQEQQQQQQDGGSLQQHQGGSQQQQPPPEPPEPPAKTPEEEVAERAAAEQQRREEDAVLAQARRIRGVLSAAKVRPCMMAVGGGVAAAWHSCGLHNAGRQDSS